MIVRECEKVNKSKIDWCDYTWNPVTGCYHGCEYCYARRIAERFASEIYKKTKDIYALDFKASLDEPIINNGKVEPYPHGFRPTLHKYRLKEPVEKTKGKKIFVCSMADLFGDWVPYKWIKQVFDICSKAPQHTYMFLSKNPGNMTHEMVYYSEKKKEKIWNKNNMWFGTSVTRQYDLARLGELHAFANNFVSIEPILGEINIKKYIHWVDWVIIGAETGNRKDKVIPKKEWIQAIIDECRANNVPVFLKNNLKWHEEIKEYPQRMLARE